MFVGFAVNLLALAAATEDFTAATTPGPNLLAGRQLKQEILPENPSVGEAQARRQLTFDEDNCHSGSLANYAEFVKICDECHTVLNNSFEIVGLCQRRCFSTVFFNGCMVDLLHDDEDAKAQRIRDLRAYHRGTQYTQKQKDEFQKASPKSKCTGDAIRGYIGTDVTIHVDDTKIPCYGADTLVKCVAKCDTDYYKAADIDVTCSGAGDMALSAPCQHCGTGNVNLQDRKGLQEVSDILSAEDCNKKCDSLDSCNFWIYHHDLNDWHYDEEQNKLLQWKYAKKCYLLKGYGRISEDKNTTSGAKNCGSVPPPDESSNA